MQGSEPTPTGDPTATADPSARAARIGRLSLRDFRNFARLEVAFPPEGVTLVGPNGSGKTNLLEAVYYLETFRSFRGSNDGELVRFGADVFRIEMDVVTPDGERSLAAAYQDRGSRKKVEVDRREVDRLSDAVGTLGAVVFSLEDVEIVRGPPSGRRRFLNILLSLVRPGYMDALRDYRSVLSQRNHALKDGAGHELLDAWTEGLVEAGARVMAARDGWVADRAAEYGDYHAAVSGGSEGWIAYEPSVGRAEVEAPSGSERRGTGRRDGAGEPSGVWAERFRVALEDSAERERRRGVTVVGPHRDEVEFTGRVAGEDPRDLRTFGSGGQQRTAALALRLVEADTLRDRLRREPVYLLDDVFAELDEDRSERLLRLLDEGRTGQAIVTSPKPNDLALRGGGLDSWRIRDGEVTTR